MAGKSNTGVLDLSSHHRPLMIPCTFAADRKPAGAVSRLDPALLHGL